jgi:hypothetical protein
MIFTEESLGFSRSTSRSEEEVQKFLQPIIRKTHSTQKHNVLICTDFTFPKFGGVETHGY